MDYASFKENSRIVASLRGMVRSGRIPHAILFHENDGGGALPLALTFLSHLYCTSPGAEGPCGHCPSCNRVEKLIHPDIHFVFPVAGQNKPVSDNFIDLWRGLVLTNPSFFENELYTAIGIEGKQSNISVWEARLLLEKLSLASVEGKWRSVVIYLPEKLNAQAANTLLKMIEEPPEKTLFLLITHAPEKVLRTVSSRCLLLRVVPLSREGFRALHPERGAEEMKLFNIFSDLMESLMEKDLAAALDVAEVLAGLSSREKQKAFCKFAGEAIRNVFLLQQGLGTLADIPAEEAEFYGTLSRALKKTFPRGAMRALDKAALYLDRNVNQKIIFCDLADKLYRLAI